MAEASSPSRLLIVEDDLRMRSFLAGELNCEGYCVSVYVDDIIISAKSDSALHACLPEIQSAAESAAITLNASPNEQRKKLT
jgi:hypothetical protein